MRVLYSLDTEALQKGVEAVTPLVATEEVTNEYKAKTDELYNEREARRQSIEVAERKAAEDAEAAAAALVAKYSVRSGSTGKSPKTPLAAQTPLVDRSDSVDSGLDGRTVSVDSALDDLKADLNDSDSWNDFQ